MSEEQQVADQLRRMSKSLTQLLDFIKEKAEAGKIEWDDDAPIFWGLIEEIEQ
jgi:hypothetical protein